MTPTHDLTIARQTWQQQVVQTVDGGLWRCHRCTWMGEHHYSTEAALAEGMRHFKKQHPDVEPVEVEMGNDDDSDA